MGVWQRRKVVGRDWENRREGGETVIGLEENKLIC